MIYKMYVDGSYHKIDKLISSAVVVLDGEDNIIDTISKVTTDSGYVNMRNVGGEIIASILALQYAKNHSLKSIEIYYDYVGIEMWALSKWKTNNIYTRDYKSFCEEIFKDIDVKFIKVKSHSGNIYNDLADTLAKEALGIS